MEINPSQEASCCSANQDIPYGIRNPKVHHRVYNNPPFFSILNQDNSVHTFPSYYD